MSAFGSEDRGVPWWLVLIEGIALVIVGIMFLTNPAATSVISAQVLGIYWIIAGIFNIIALFIDRSAWGWKLFAAIISIAAGIVILNNPIASTIAVANVIILMLGLYGLFAGAVGLIRAFQGAGWGVGVLGIVSILFGFILLANRWAFTFSLPWTLGILFVVGGIATIILAFRGRKVEHTPAPAVEAPAAATAVSTVVAETAITEVAEEDEAEVVEAVIESAAVETVISDDGEVVEETIIEETVAAEMVAETPDTAVEEIVAAEIIEEVVAEVHEETTEEVIDDSVHASPGEAAKFHAHADKIEGIGPVYSEKLEAIGINSPQTLLERGATRQGRAEIAEQTGISGKLILTWVNHADLFRIKGVGSQYADLLEEAGVDTVVELAQRNPNNLYEKILSVNEEKHLVREVPSQHMVEDWVAQAKELPRVLTY